MIEGFSDASEMLRGGVYALAYRGEIVYIGKAKRMLRRVASHLTEWSNKRRGAKTPSWAPIEGIYFDAVYIRVVHPDKVDEVEASLIALYKPKLNTKLTKGASTAPFSLNIRGVNVQFNQPPPPRAIEIERKV